MSDELIKVAEHNSIVTITLNRPDRLNALVGHMRRDLAEALEEAGSDPHVRVVVITGEGRVTYTSWPNWSREMTPKSLDDCSALHGGWCSEFDR